MKTNIIKVILLALTILNSASLWAKHIEKSWHFDSFGEAEEAQEHIKFQLDSSKLGMFTSTVDGYVRDFSLSANNNENELDTIKITLAAKSFDTDKKTRNRVMWSECLQTSDHPEIIITIDKKILLLSGKEIDVAATMNILGKPHPIRFTFQSTKTDTGILIKGKSNLSFKNLEVPNPSIMVASVKDEIKVSFEILLDK